MTRTSSRPFGHRSHRTYASLIATVAALGISACADSMSPASNDTTLREAFAAAVAGTSSAQTSFQASDDDAGHHGWSPGGDDGLEHRSRGIGLMGGGLGLHFHGFGFGAGFGRGPFGDDWQGGDCAFVAATGRVTCAATTHHGLTIVRSASFADASGATQQAFDSVTTNTVNVQSTVSGTVAFHDDRGRRHGGGGSDDAANASIANDTTVVSITSERTVSGLAKGSTQRTVNGTSAGRETTTGTDTSGHFTVVRVAGDTTRGVVIPVVASGVSYPTAGSITRSMQVTVTYGGQAAKSSSRREVITYDGTNVAHITVVQDGVTKTCTLTMPNGRPTCQ
jgi:hypothetical protein